MASGARCSARKAGSFVNSFMEAQQSSLSAIAASRVIMLLFYSKSLIQRSATEP